MPRRRLLQEERTRRRSCCAGRRRSRSSSSSALVGGGRRRSGCCHDDVLAVPVPLLVSRPSLPALAALGGVATYATVVVVGALLLGLATPAAVDAFATPTTAPTAAKMMMMLRPPRPISLLSRTASQSRARAGLASVSARRSGGRAPSSRRFSALSATAPTSHGVGVGVGGLGTDEPDYDVIVIGGGHAGCDSASASARTGARTALITQRLDTIGELSCNPSIGGIGKGHLVKEVDALGGVMGEVADRAGIHFRMLNRRKGPAVRGPRGQMDRDLYKGAMQDVILNVHGENLVTIEASVEDLLLDEGEGIDALAPLADASGSGIDTDAGRKMADLASAAANVQHRRARIRGVVVTKPDGVTTQEITARCVVITTGTFLRGVLMIGKDRYVGGRHLRDSEQVEPPSVGLARTLERFHFPLGRLKTGTPPRLDGRTINWDACDIQPSENPAVPFSHLRQFRGEQPPLVTAGTLIDCYKSCTNEATHRLVTEYAHLLPEYDGMDGKGNGPRYCPSIYKKVERFPDRTGHNSFLEPEGLNTHIVYPNGMSGPYPEEIQLQIMRTMVGLEEVDIVRPGYDVEYDFVNPQCLTHALETKTIGGLYLAGQICGTTGYEEAAAQGIIAGANAGRAAAAAAAEGDRPAVPFVLGRDEAYIGVLIDDLVTRGTTEPYRMFTSRAEYRISLRADNADLRLTGKAAEYGLVTDLERLASLEAREGMIEDRLDGLKKFRLFVTDWAERGGNDLMGGATAHDPKRRHDMKSAEEVLGMPHVTLEAVERIMRDVQAEDGQRQPGQSVGDSDDTDDDVASTAAVMEPSPSSIYDTVEASVKYKSYVRRQHKDMESWRKAQGARIPPDLVYDHGTLPTLSSEELEKLNLVRPSTFAEASRISGVTPQSLVYLYHHVTNRNRRARGSSSGSSSKEDRKKAVSRSASGSS